MASGPAARGKKPSISGPAVTPAAAKPLYRPAQLGDNVSVTVRSTEKIGNLMNDPRVRRGLPTAVPPTRSLAASLKGTLTPDPSKTISRSSALIASGYLPTNARAKGPGPFDAQAAPRAYEPVDLSAHLIEHATPVEKREEGSQTDGFIALAPTPAYRQPKTGIDTHTQVPHGTVRKVTSRVTADGDAILFDFDKAVGGLVATIVDKVLEQTVTELRHEKELHILNTRRDKAVAIKQRDVQKEEDWKQFVKATAQRRTAVVASAQLEALQVQDAMRKVVGSALSRSLIHDGFSSIFSRLKERGYWKDTLRAEITSDVLPDLFAGVAAHVDRINLAESTVATAIVDALARGGALFQERLRQEEEERNRKIAVSARLWLPTNIAESMGYVVFHPEGESEEGKEGEEDGEEEGAESRGPTRVDVTIGPLQVGREDTVADLQVAIHEWVTTADEKGSADPTKPSISFTQFLTHIAGRKLTLHAGEKALPLSSIVFSLPEDTLASLQLQVEGGIPELVAEEDTATGIADD